MDLQMPRVGGVEATRRLTDRMPRVRILVLTMVDEDQAVFAAVQAGAMGYLLKGAGQAEIARAFAGGGTGVPSAVPSPPLSDREREVLTLTAEGVSNGDIARRLFLSDKTVRNYRSSIFTKLDVETRAAAIVRAREAGLGA